MCLKTRILSDREIRPTVCRVASRVAAVCFNRGDPADLPPKDEHEVSHPPPASVGANTHHCAPWDGLLKRQKLHTLTRIAL